MLPRYITRCFASAILASAAFLAMSTPSLAQSADYKLPQLGIDYSGDCKRFAVQERGSKAMVPLGCVTPSGWDLTPKKLRIPKTTGSGDAVSIDGNGIVSASGLNAISDGSNSNPINAFWAQIGNDNLIRYANQARLTSKFDGEAWESALGADCQFKTGFNRIFAPGMTVAVGDNITAQPTGATEAFTYRVTQAGTLGTSSASWGGVNSAPFTSGTAQLKWINYTNLSTKLCFTTTTFVDENGGNSWGANFNFQLLPMPRQPRFQTGIEQDFVNNSGYDCLLLSGNTCNAYNMFIDGKYSATVGMNIGSHGNGPNHVTEWGFAVQGKFLAKDAAIAVNTSGRVGIGIGRYWPTFGRSVYENAAYLDETQSPRAISLGGIYSNAALSTADATITPQGGFPTAFSMSDNQQVCWQNINACMRYDSTATALTYRKNGLDVFSLTDAGVLGANSLKATAGGSTYQVLVDYDTAGDFGRIQSNHNGLYSTTLKLNPNNGRVEIGPGGLALAQFTVAALPACGAGQRGSKFAVTDAAGTIAYRGSPAGGGNQYAEVSCNGSGYEYH